jgi:hypothetical protein
MKTKVDELIERSGNTFHYQVVNFLRERSWTVLVSPYYSDYISDKSKEIDIIAEKQYEVAKPGRDKKLGILKVTLFIECKYINSEIVLWFDEKDLTRARNKVIRTTPLKEGNIFTEKHHYLAAPKVAKLFTPNAKNDDVFYKALNQTLNAMIYHRSEGLASIFPSISKIMYALSYPLILCNEFAHLYRVDAGQSTYGNVDQNFQLEVNYAYLSNERKSQSDYFLIDVIDFNKFDDFLNGLLKTDLEAICHVLS